jgi:hypothetical protein
METRERRSKDFTNKNIFIGIDNHKKNWKVNILCEAIDHKTFTMDPAPEILNKYLHKNFPRVIILAHTKLDIVDSGHTNN